MKTTLVWVITPRRNSDADETWLPGESEKDHQKALVYAQERLEQLWDEFEEGEEIKVTMTLKRVDVAEYEEVNDNDD